MFGKNPTHGYTVIEGGANRPREHAPVPGIQGTLFPFPDSRSLVFSRFSDVSQNQFISLLANLRPAFIVDLRRVPRFDVGRMNRQIAFEHFMKNDCVYVDLSTIDEGAHQKLKAIRRRVEAHPRPILFLTDGPSGRRLEDGVVNVFYDADKKWNVYEFPPVASQTTVKPSRIVRLSS
jgi:hypothetical protein